ncbi:uncharacterized protein [Amphiura filiformis]|uniref:uncharacterized protein n=1 Tax=Amphiura filiformis TaxID=82378 RepID=UPI003B20F986
MFSKVLFSTCLWAILIGIVFGQDTEVPVISNCPSDFGVSVPVGTPTRSVQWTIPTALDNVTPTNQLTSVATHTPPATLDVGNSPTTGITEVSYLWGDAANNVATCTFRITVREDSTDPVITNCPSSQTVQSGGGTSATATWTPPTATDDISTTLDTTISPATATPGSSFTVGDTEVTYTFTDGAQNSATCTFTITVQAAADTTAPTITSCPSDITVDVAQGTTSATATWTEPTATDNVTPANQLTTVRSHNSGSTFNLGTTTVVYSISDAAGNGATCTFNVIVQTGTSTPIITNCPSNIVVQGTGTTAIASWTPPTGTSSINGVAISPFATHTPGTSFPIGNTDVTYVFIDSAGNSAQCSFTVTVVQTQTDTTAPTVNNCPSDITQTVANAGSTVAVTWTPPTATDNVTPVGQLFQTQTHTPGSQFGVGTTSVQYAFTDAAGNTGLCSFNVVVTVAGVDTTVPTVNNCPGDISQTVANAGSTATVTWQPPTATDNVTPVGQLTQTQTHTPGSQFGVGTTAVQYAFTDAAGNTGLCSFNVIITVTGAPITVSGCPTSTIIQNVPAGTTGPVQVTFAEPTATGSNVQMFSTHRSGGNFPIGDTTVVFVFIDDANNQVECQFTVRVQVVTGPDTTAPTVNNCPSDITQTVANAGSTATVTWTPPTATDNVTPVGQLTQTQTHTPGSQFAVGTTAVQYAFTDAAGNTGFCSFNVIITVGADTTLPTINNCPSDITQTVANAGSTATVTWTPPTATDNVTPVGQLVGTQTHTPGSQFGVGTTAVQYAFTDAAGNTAFCTFNVIISVSTVDTTLPTINNCPSDITQTVANAGSTATVTWTPPTATDNVTPAGQLFQTQTHTPGTQFAVGTTAVQYAFTDAAGNTAFCTFNVVISVAGGPDTTPPTVTNCPSDITQTVANVGSTATVTWQPPTATDNVTPAGQIIQAQTHSPGTQFQVGTTTVSYLFTDAAGNNAICTFTVTVSVVTTDTTPPVIVNCPNDITETVPAGTAFATATWTPPTATDNVTPSNQIACFSNFAPGAQFQLGSTGVAYVCQDAAGNDATCQFNVIVQTGGPDTTLPVIANCPSDITQIAQPGQTQVAVSWTPPTATDNVTPVNQITSFSTRTPNELFPIGTTMVAYIFGDEAGNEATCSFNVIVQIGTGDTTAPVITNCPSDITVTVPFGTPQTNVFWIAPRATDNVTPTNQITTVSTHNPRDSFSVGRTTVSYIFSDAAGNTDTCSFSVSVIEIGGPDVTPPVISNCPNDITQNVAAGVTQVPVTWTPPTAADNETPSNQITMVATHSPNDIFNLGQTTVTYIFGDLAGNERTCSFIVTVQMSTDTVAPVIVNCPADITRQLAPGTTSIAIPWTAPTATDNVTPVNQINVVQTHTPNQVFTVGTTQVTYIFTDAAGNEARCSFNIIVTSATDAVPPVVVNCPSDITRQLAAGTSSIAIQWTAPTATDNVTPVNQITVFQTHTPNQVFTVGTTQVTYIFTDAAGNDGRCSFNIIVTPQGDTVAPVIANCPSDITQQAAAGQTSITVSWNTPTATDNVTPVNQITSVFTHIPNLSLFPVGQTTTVTYLFRDQAGNEAVCAFDVTVQSLVADTIPPVIANCPQDISVSAPQGANSAQVPWTPPTATDNVTPTGSIQSIATHAPNDPFRIGQTMVTYIFNDEAGNSATCNFNIIVQPSTVIDVIPPVVNNCPANIFRTVAPGTPSLQVTWVEPTATDETSAVNVFQTNRPGDLYTVGTTTVTYIFRDDANNQAMCAFNIVVTESTIVDTVPPVVSNCPNSPITATLNAGQTSTAVTWIEPTATDAVTAVVSRFMTHNPGDMFGVGDTEVSYFFTDDANNEATCTFTVSVFATGDTQPPNVFNCPMDIIRTLPAGQTSAVIDWIEPTATDNSGQVPNRVSSHTPLSVFNVGTTQVVYTFTDASNNQATCTFSVQLSSTPVGDTTPPTVNGCPNNIVESLPFGTVATGSAVSWTEPTATDNSGVIPTRTVNFMPGSFFPIGVREVVYTFADAAGNTNQCRFLVTVAVNPNDITPPVISDCPTDISVDLPNGVTNSIVSWIEPTATDNSGVAPSVSRTHVPMTSFNAGLTEVTYTYTDQAENIATCVFTVTLNVNTQDTVDPVPVNCPNDITLAVGAGQTSSIVTWFPEPTATDNSGITPMLSQTHRSGDTFQIGTTVVTYSFVDGSGNVATCSFTVQIIQISNAFVTDCPSSETYTIPAGQTSRLVQWTPEPSAADGFGNVVPITSQTHTSGQSFPLGSTTVTYIFTGNNNIILECRFTINIMSATTDTNPPVVTNCPNDFTVDLPPGFTNAVVSWVEPQATDAEGFVPLISQSHMPMTAFMVGTTTVRYVYADLAGNQAVCEFDVLLASDMVDNTAPVFNVCPQSQSFTVPNSQVTQVVSWIPPIATDDSGQPPAITNSHSPGQTFAVGDTQVRYIATDGAGNQATCTFIITVSVDSNDNLPPIITRCPEDQVITVPVGLASVRSFWNSPTATDNSGLTPTLAQSHTSGELFPVGSTDVEYTYTDGSGNSAVCSFRITVIQVSAAVVNNCPDAMTYVVPASITSRVVTWPTEPTSFTTGDGTGTVIPLVSQTHQSGNAFPLGETVVKYMFQDGLGNIQECRFSVTIMEMDSTRPTIMNCPEDIRLTAPVGRQVVVDWSEPTATDDSGGLVNTFKTHEPGSVFDTGDTLVSYTFTDPTGNVDICRFTISITRIDTEPPMVNGCPGQVRDSTTGGVFQTPVSWTEPFAVDNSGVTPTVTQSHQPGSLFPVGTTQVTYTFRDGAGNEATCVFDVIVSAADNMAPVISGCPQQPIGQVVSPGMPSTTVTWTEPTATDNSGLVPTVTRSHSPGDVFFIGLTTVRYVFTDNAGNSETCTFDISATGDIIYSVAAIDMTPPVVTGCPDPIFETAPLEDTSVAVLWIEPTALDDSMVAPQTAQTHTPGQHFPIGVTTVRYSFSDDLGNLATCSFDITVEAVDTLPPVISGCPGTITSSVTSGTTSTLVSWAEPTATDNSGVPPTVTQTHGPGTSRFPVGTTPVTYTFSDQTGNEARCTFDVAVVAIDMTPPVVTGCPDPIFEMAPIEDTSVAVLWIEPTALDDSMVAPQTAQTHTPGQHFPIGVTTVRYSFSDDLGNLATCSFDITVVVVDTLLPVISGCPGTITQTVTSGTTSIPTTWTEPTATDNSGMTPSVTQSHRPGDSFPVGTTQVTYTFSDQTGNEASCTFDVTVLVVDSTPPVISNCPNTIMHSIPPGSWSSTVRWSQPTAIDDSGQVPRVTQSHLPGAMFNIGTTLVIYTFSDQAGNQAQCIFSVIVIVVDAIAPIISNCPDSVSYTVPFGTLTRSVTWTEPVAQDNSGVEPIMMKTHQPGDNFLVGSTDVIYIFTDQSGNTARCTFSITIVQSIDTELPVVIGCPNSVDIIAPAGSMTQTASWIEPTATDNSGMTPTVTQSHQPGDSFPIGMTQVRYTFRDQSGNEALCTFSVTVTVTDTNAPVISNCPDPISLSVPIGTDRYPVTWTEPTAVDNSGQPLRMIRSHAPGNEFGIGESTVTYIFIDDAGNDAICTFTITGMDDVVLLIIGTSRVESQKASTPKGFLFNELDNVPPVIAGCPDSITRNIPVGTTSATVTWTEPTATDNSGVAVECFKTNDPGASFPVGTTPVTYFCPDQAGNDATCTFSITVTTFDNTPPVISNCPQSSIYTVPFGTTSRVVTWNEPTASDNSGMTPSVMQTHMPGEMFPVGTTQVMYMFTDNAGNMVTCAFSITVNTLDTSIPVVTNCPQPDTVTVPFGTTSQVVTWQEPTVVDDSGLPPTITQSHRSGESFPVGATTVMYTFADQAGNEAMCVFTVNVVEEDTIPPVFQNCPSDVSHTVPLGTDSRVVTWTEPTVTDNTGVSPMIFRSIESGASFRVGTTRVEYFAFDDAGNEATCSFAITVIAVDSIPPTVTGCPGPISNPAPIGTSNQVVTWTEPTATDNSGVTPTVTRSHVPGDSFPVGSTEVTYTFRDAEGNEAFCRFMITVLQIDNTPPQVQNCPNSNSVQVPFGSTSRVVTWNEPTATDDSGTVNVLQTHRSGDLFFLGIAQVMYTFTDPAGNMAPCTFSITVTAIDGNPPVVTSCPPSSTYTVPLGTSSRVVTWQEPTATDNSGIPPTVLQTHRSGDAFPVGDTRVSYTFTDREGNEAFCSFNIMVNAVDNVPPVISGCPSSSTFNVPLGTTSRVITWREPTATDNSGVPPLSIQSHASGDRFPIGSNTVTYIFMDSAGNDATCMFTYTVTEMDSSPPMISGCPQSSSYTVPLGTTSRAVSWTEPTVTDDSGTQPTVVMSHQSGQEFPVGRTQVSYVFIDGAGNEAACSFFVIVTEVDSSSPTITGCPQSSTYTVPLGTTSRRVRWTEPTATDDSGQQPTVIMSHQSGQEFPVGTAQVTYIFIDGAGNEATCSFSVIVTAVDSSSPTISGCPQSSMYTVPLGTSSRTVSWTEPTATDDSGQQPTVIMSHQSGQAFPVGTTRVTYIFSDDAGNEATCSFSVIVTAVDSSSPTISGCPELPTYTVPLGTSSRAVSWTEPTATDDSGTQPTVIRTHQSGQAFPVGTTQVTYIFSDDAGNEATCSFSVIVTALDSMSPVITNCPQTTRQTVPLGTSSRAVSWTEPTATDDSGMQPTVIRTHRSGQAFPVGTTQVTYIFSDDAGNEATCSFSVIVTAVDSMSPVITNCPQTTRQTVPLGTSSRAVSWTEPTATDDSGMQPTVIRTHQSGQAFPVGTTQVTYIFSDDAGNEATCSFSVIVTAVDSRQPVITNCPQTTSQTVPLGTSSRAVSWTEPIATDDSGQQPTVIRTHRSGQEFPVGTTQVTYIFSDDAGNEATCSFSLVLRHFWVSLLASAGAHKRHTQILVGCNTFLIESFKNYLLKHITVTAVDSTPPVITNCPQTTTQTVPLGTSFASVTWTEPTATDNSGIAPVRVGSHQPGESFPVGTSQVTYIFTDQAGNDAICSFSVVVTAVDSTPPVITNCPQTTTQTVPLGTSFASVTWTEPTATDNSGIAPVRFGSHQPGESFPVGTSQVTYIFTDQAGNDAICSFSVVVTAVDSTPPVITNCPQTTTQTVPLGTSFASVTWTEPTATDNSGIAPVRVGSHQPGESFPVGTSQVTYIFTDQAGNDAICSFSVVVTAVDSMPPVITNCPQTTTQTVPLGTSFASVTWTEPTATDNSGIAPVRFGSHQPGESFPVGTSQVTYIFTDQAGNDAICSFSVVVTAVDSMPPVITNCPQTTTQTVPLGTSFASVTWTEPTATDNSGIAPVRVASHQPGESFPVGTSQVTYIFTDQAGNDAICSFSVVVVPIDSSVPVVTDCPQSMQYTIPLGTPTRIVTWTEPTATDNSGVTPSVTRSHQPGSSFPVGTTPVSYTFRDGAGNEATCSFSIMVLAVDSSPPVIIGCPPSATYTVPLGTTSSIATWVEPTATDNSGVMPTTLKTHNPGDSFMVGMTQVSYIVSDSSGNDAFCSFGITVLAVDTLVPVISGCPSSDTYSVPFGTSSRSVTWIEPTAVDNSGGQPTLSRTHQPGQNFPVGATPVTYTFTDSSGNQAQCSFTITVEIVDSIPPVISGCPQSDMYTVPLGTSARVVSWTEPTATDDSGVMPTSIKTHKPGDSFTLGVTQVLYIFMDGSGNDEVCSFSVIVVSVDTDAPIINGCPNSARYPVPFGTSSRSVTWIEPTAFDNSGSQPTVSKSHQPGSNFPVGVTPVTYTFTDSSGNQAQCSFSVTVIVVDTIPPVISGCPQSPTYTVPLGTLGRVASWIEPTATDDSGVTPTYIQSHSPGDRFMVGITRVTYIFSDSSGNEARCSFGITVLSVDSDAPIVSGCPNSASYPVPFGTQSRVVTWIEPTAFDNSGIQPTVVRSHQPGQNFPVGRTPVTYIFTDSSGNEAQCSFSITVDVLCHPHIQYHWEHQEELRVG